VNPLDGLPESFSSNLESCGHSHAKICAVMSCPRLGWNDFWGHAFNAFTALQIPFRRVTGVFWEQCIQNSLESLIADGYDYALCVDYDTVFTAEHVMRLVRHMTSSPDIDALAGLQVKRDTVYPLYTTKSRVTCQAPFKVTTAHFGLTLIKLASLRDVPKPWFWAQPCELGTWHGDAKVDADIAFWNHWNNHGKNVYIDPSVSIGHLEVMVSEFDENMNVRHIPVQIWCEEHR
jgi:hypothetical protein